MPKNFRQLKNFRLLQQIGGAAAPPSTPSNTPMELSLSGQVMSTTVANKQCLQLQLYKLCILST